MLVVLISIRVEIVFTLKGKFRKTFDDRSAVMYGSEYWDEIRIGIIRNGNVEIDMWGY